jgi:hypothetical protein
MILKYGGCFATVAAIEKFRQRFHFDRVDLVHIKPSTITRQDDCVRLRDKVRSRRCFDGAFSLRECSVGSILIRLSNIFLRCEAKKDKQI